MLDVQNAWQIGQFLFVVNYRQLKISFITLSKLLAKFAPIPHLRKDIVLKRCINVTLPDLGSTLATKSFGGALSAIPWKSTQVPC